MIITYVSSVAGSDSTFHFDSDPSSHLGPYNFKPDPIFHLDKDPDPSFHCDADPYPTFHFDADRI